MRLGIVGCGFVGKAVCAAFDTATVEQFVVDPKLNNNTISQLVDQNPHFVFVCVPTPQSSDGSVDISTVSEVLDQLEDSEYGGVVVLKSTITPDLLTKLSKQYWFSLVYNPEFLREAHAVSDFVDPAMQILGGAWHDCTLVERAYNQHSRVKVVPTFKTDLITASLLKYTINSWLATKVVFMNQLHALHGASGANSTWEQFTDMLQRDPRIGSSHLQVPGTDGQPGFGGHCFPKDTAALVKYAQEQGSPLDVVEKARKINNILRNG